MSLTPDRGITRRAFLDRLLGLSAFAWAATILYPVYEYFKVPPQSEPVPTSVVAANIKKLKPGQAVVFKFGPEPALLINGADGKLRAFTAVCTHLQCTVQYRPDMGRIWCACHNGMYDLNGRNISGPPPRPLTEMKVVLKGDDVIVSKV